MLSCKVLQAFGYCLNESFTVLLWKLLLVQDTGNFFIKELIYSKSNVKPEQNLVCSTRCLLGLKVFLIIKFQMTH